VKRREDRGWDCSGVERERDGGSSRRSECDGTSTDRAVVVVVVMAAVIVGKVKGEEVI